MDEDGPHSGASPTPADDEFTRETLAASASGASGARRMAALRALLAVVGCVLLALTVLVATGTAGGLWQWAQFAWLQHNTPTITRAALTAQPAARRALPGGWSQQPPLTLPNPDVSSYIPTPGDPNTFYGCSGLQTTATGGKQVGPLIFWFTHDAGEHWTSIRLPGTRVTYCDVTFASDTSGRLILQGQFYGGCTDIMAYISADGGVTWQAIPSFPAAPPPDADCGFSALPSGRHIYFYYNYTTRTGPPDKRVSVNHLTYWRSDDGGQSWKRLDQNRPPGDTGFFYPRLLDDGETLFLAVNTFDPGSQGNPTNEQSWLWVSRDAGDSWQPLADFKDILIQNILPQPDGRALAPTQAHPLYLVSEAGVPSRYLRIQLAQMTDPHHWEPLPPLPIAGASPAHLGITSVLTTTPSGRLIVFGLGPDSHIPSSDEPMIDTQQLARQWLWEWDAQASRWTLLAPTLDAPWPTCSDHCWNGWITPASGSDAAASMELWVRAFDGETASWKTYSIPYVR